MRPTEGRPAGDVVVNAGVSDAPGVLTFFDVPEYHGWSTFLPEAAQSYRDKGVSVGEKARSCHHPGGGLRAVRDREIDFLKIDVEGFKRQAIRGADWKRWRPRVVVVESTWPDLWESLLLENDYLFCGFRRPQPILRPARGPRPDSDTGRAGQCSG